MLGCDGAMRLHWEHFSRISDMAGVMPGQKNDESALEHICVIPWCAECSESRILFLRGRGTTIRMSSGRSDLVSGKPSSIVFRSRSILESLAVAVRISSQETDSMMESS